MRLHFREYGHGRPVIVLHGLFGSLENWHTISRKLGGRYHVFAVDLRNHGHSPHSPEMNYPVMAEDVMALVRSHNLGRVSVLGHSLGGKTAMQLASSFPDQTGRLIVVDIAPRAYTPRHEEVFAALLALQPERFATRSEAEEALAASIPQLTVRRFLLKNLAREAGGGFRWKLNLRYIFQNYAALAGPITPRQPFAGPALFVGGGCSGYLREQDLPMIHRWFPLAQLRIIPGAGHWLHVEAPDVFVEWVTEFLAADETGAAIGIFPA